MTILMSNAAHRLAYYKAAQGIGVLAPRGWYCFETYGSSGETLYVSPEPINSTDLFSSSTGFAGAAIQLTLLDGDTSGRFGVAKAIARVFPTHRTFVNNVIREGIEPATAFPAGPYPHDKLTYKGKEILEYETPAQTEGLGTQSRLRQNATPISGVLILAGNTPDLFHLSLRLPNGQAELGPAIIQQVERDAMIQSH